MPGLQPTGWFELAKISGIGCVALANTNHWMRGGYYGWQAARKGVVFIGWSNTIGNMPAYGATDTRLGNNPVVISLPYQGNAIVLDMAMSQFSYGAMEAATLKGEQLPVFGGYDQNGNLTKDPSAVLETRRMLSIGYWKGAGLSLLLTLSVLLYPVVWLRIKSVKKVWKKASRRCHRHRHHATAQP
jgi:3-dehydro-L-gulonate 2-dehydrogenase